MMPFIVGVGRSGTTLLRLMLDSHPELAIPPETHFITELIQENDIKPARFIDIIVDSPTWPDFKLREDELRECIENITDFTLAAGLRAFYALYAKKYSKKLYGDKTPPYMIHMKAIQKVLPEARFIHLIRDGRDVSLSYRGLWFGPGDNISSSALFWSERIKLSRQQAAGLNYYIEIKYEDLITNSEATLARICSFLDVRYSEKMLDYHTRAESRLSELSDRFDKDGSTRLCKEKWISIFSLTKLPLDKSRINSWKNEMNNTEKLEFEKIAGELLSELGYETIHCKY